MLNAEIRMGIGYQAQKSFTSINNTADIDTEFQVPFKCKQRRNAKNSMLHSEAVLLAGPRGLM